MSNTSGSDYPTTVPTLPDGTPDYGRASGQAQHPSSGKTSIWNIPTGVDPNKPLWFDIGHHLTQDPTLNADARRRPTPPPVTSTEIMASPTKIMRQYAAMSANNPGGFLALQKLLASGPWGTVHETGAFDSLDRVCTRSGDGPVPEAKPRRRRGDVLLGVPTEDRRDGASARR
jgi:hypothetical protein